MLRLINLTSLTVLTLTKKKEKTLQNLKEDQTIIISKPDKGRGIVILDKQDYITKVEELLSDFTKFKQILSDPAKFITKLEDKLNRTLRSLKEKLSEITYKQLFATGSKPGILYGLPKVHKFNCPMRPILNAIGTFNYYLAKFFVPLLSELCVNQYTVKNSVSFKKDILDLKFNNNIYLASFDIKSLFTNIPLDETIQICTDQIFATNTTFMNLNKKEFHNLLSLSVKDSVFLFNDKYYKQVDGVAMGSPLGPTLANVFLCFHEVNWLSQCPPEFTPLYYRRYVDDCFLIFNDVTECKQFLDYLNSKHSNIEFTFESNVNDKLPFLDLLIHNDNGKLSTEIYRKPTFTGLGTNYFSFVPEIFKVNAISTLLHRAFTLTSSWLKFHEEITYLKDYFLNNGYPVYLFEKVLKNFLNNIFTVNSPTCNVPKEILYLSFPFYGRTSYAIRKELSLILRKAFPQLDIKFIFNNSFKIGSFFRYKDKIPDLMCSSVIYKYTCSDCNVRYIGSTMRTLHQRMSEHLGVSFRTNSPVGNPTHSEIRNHARSAKHRLRKEDFKILDTSNNSNLRILESIYIVKLKPELNGTESAETLHTL